ncbi:hypothetical protein RBTH_05280 [Bacillus thuringiensis serovar israelensis ATCC 35646]|nr:hypothetical protein RBTH_05280 [Bacillus thuringiensis serovar israelensis ATCC 35646]
MVTSFYYYSLACSNNAMRINICFMCKFYKRSKKHLYRMINIYYILILNSFIDRLFKSINILAEADLYPIFSPIALIVISSN